MLLFFTAKGSCFTDIQKLTYLIISIRLKKRIRRYFCFLSGLTYIAHHLKDCVRDCECVCAPWNWLAPWLHDRRPLHLTFTHCHFLSSLPPSSPPTTLSLPVTFVLISSSSSCLLSPPLFTLFSHFTSLCFFSLFLSSNSSPCRLDQQTP